MAAQSDSEPSSRAKPLPEVATDLWELTKDYAKQETIEPLKGLGAFLGYGVVGAVFLGIGTMLLLLGGLRALQTQTGTTFTGNWSWAPYLIAVAAGLVLIGLALLRITRRKGPGA